MILRETRTKIVATIGPASKDPEILEKMFREGVDVCRLNFSHGTHTYHKETFEIIRDLAPSIAILVDLSGPKIRIGNVKTSFEIQRGDNLIITSDDVVGTQEIVSVSHKPLPTEVKPGHTIYINDGLVGLTVDRIENKKDIYTTCFAAGSISSRKGINAPEVPLSLYFPTEKDQNDIDFALTLEPDFFAASFVRRAEDLKLLRSKIEEQYKKTQIISKIEHQDALTNLDSILSASDGLMVARGDLGIEIPTEDVPIVQKDIIQKCNDVGKPVIVATQMLESMTINKRPTRAEASDVSNAVIDGADAVMLSGETASGQYPVETIEYMDKIAQRAESIIFNRHHQIVQDRSTRTREFTIPEVLGYNADFTVRKLNCAAILALTRTGSTARLIAKYRPKCPIIACTSLETTYRQLQLSWGVIPLQIPVVTSIDLAIFHSVKNAYTSKLIKLDDQVLIIAGTLLGIPAKTNLFQVLQVSDVLALESHFKQ